MADDILVLPDLEPGQKSFRIADIHGGLSAFKQVLASLKKGDRAICIGDLTDRGEDSYGVIQAIIQHRKDIANGAEKGEFYSSFGNHEENILEAIYALETNLQSFLNKDGTLNEKKFDAFCQSNRYVSSAIDVRNGGQWLVDLFKEDVLAKQITIHSITGKPDYRAGSKIVDVKDYLTELPYLIYADNTINGHADIPLSDAELLYKINNGDLTLTPKQKEYIMWSRENDHYTPFADMGRNGNSILAFVGHNIVSQHDDNYTPSVRYHTNTINLDVASFKYGIIFAVDVNNPGELIRFGQLKEKVIDYYPHEFYSREEASINNHMDDQRLKLAMLREAQKCHNLAELDDLIESYVKKYEEFYPENNYYTAEQLFDSVVRHQAFSAQLLDHAIMHERELERLLLAGFDRRFKFSNDMTLLDYCFGDTGLSRVYVQTILLDAIKRNDMTAAEEAIENGASIFCPDANGITPIEYMQTDAGVLDLILANAGILEVKPDDNLSLNDRYVNAGWNNMHFVALTSDVASYADFIKGLNPKSPEFHQLATIPAVCFNKMMAAVLPGEQAAILEAVLVGFYEKHPIDNNGMVSVSPHDIRRIFNLVDKTENIIKAEQSMDVRISQQGLFGQSHKTPEAREPEQEQKQKDTITLSRTAKRE